MSDYTAIALSGGIDSMVAAALLKDQGQRVIALHFLTGFENIAPKTQATEAQADSSGLQERMHRKLAPIADQLEIPLYIIDLRKEFKSRVVDYFVQAYAAGKTPNPCLVCNPSIKFDILFQKAAAQGAVRMATGHYARIQTRGGAARRLLRGIDPVKDQSYFLARLTQSQLEHIVLPLGAMTKEETRQTARTRGLRPVITRESQDICFIRETGYADFLLGQEGFDSRPGPIINMAGRTIGQHQGLHRYTVGQRRGINCPAAEPYYVVRLDAKRNCLKVGRKQDLFTAQCLVTHVNWIDCAPQQSIKAQVQVRYRHKAVPATVTPLADDCARVVFDHPEAAVTPGQGAVFFKDEEVLGGGWIQ